jgi:hypothetical protein
LTPYALATIGAQGASDYEQAIPDRTTKFFTEDIARREADIEKRRSTNINDALIQAGLGAMRAKPKFRGSAGLFEVIGEGGQAGFDVLRQGRKDIMQSEEAINAARAKIVEAEMLRDDRKFKASSDARKEAIELNNYGLNLAKTKSAIAFQDVQAQRIAQMAPYEIAESQARAQAYRTRGTTISDADQKAAEEYAKGVLMRQDPPLLPGNPNYLPAFQTAVQQYLMQIRGAPGGIPAAAAAPVTGQAEFLRIKPE